jgi:hypothetical protein
MRSPCPTWGDRRAHGNYLLTLDYPLPAIFALRDLGRRQANEILESRKAA